jgi:4-methyl-5(b-hydroxyethyl)-thiazole monophosphate biosynthesis
MKKILVLLANGFEDIEMVASVDLWRRGKIQVDLVSIGDLKVKTGTGSTILADVKIDDVNETDYDLLFLPGGGGVKALDESKQVRKLISEFMKKEKYVSAICAAPLILGKMGILDNRVFTCYPSFEKFAPEGVYKTIGVIQDGNVITGRGVGYVFDFALYVLELLQGKDIRYQVEEGTLIVESKKGLE